MDIFTPQEQVFVERSRKEALSDDRRVRLALLGFVAVCFGAVMIVVPEAVRWSRDAATLPDFEKTLGFAIVIIAAVGSFWSFARSMRVAHSAVSKLYELCHCPTCARDLAVQSCPHCATHAEK